MHPPKAGGVAAPGRLPLEQASIGIVLSLVFVSRWLLSGRNSYWLDELLSVVTYGIQNESASDALDELARHSVHPPLYQLVLYHWMRVFGDGEVATRFLSNLYVTGAGFFLYLMVRRAMGQRRALMAAIFFSLMYVPVYYAMETRSYAQSLLLSSLSSVSLCDFMRLLASPRPWQAQLRTRACFLLVAANAGLILTHYYNVFFLGAQGVFVLGWVLWRTRADSGHGPARIAKRMVIAAIPLVAPLALLLASWGAVLVNSYRSLDGKHRIETVAAVQDPFSAFFEHAVRPNFVANDACRGFSTTLVVLCAALLLLRYGEQAVAAYRNRPPRLGRRVLGSYALVMAFLPFVFAWALFGLSGQALYRPRYFAFTAPPLAILLVLATEQAVLLIARLTFHRRTLRGYLVNSALVTFVVTTALVLPGTYAAATSTKHDWRGTAQLVADVTGQDPDHKYILYETGHGGSRISYYLKRVGTAIRPRGTVTPGAEKNFRKSKLARHVKLIARYDFLILTFTHLPATMFEKTLAKLDAKYEPHIRILQEGRGIVIYRVSKELP